MKSPESDWQKGYNEGIDDTHKYYATDRLHPREIEAFITHVWGKRCKIKDIDEFPELLEGGSRCACCEMWEIYDYYLDEIKANK